MSGSTPSLMMSVLRNLNPMRAWGGALALGPLAFTLVGMLGMHRLVINFRPCFRHLTAKTVPDFLLNRSDVGAFHVDGQKL